MIKQAEIQNAYALGRQQALEKLAGREEQAAGTLGLTLALGGIGNYLGKRDALSRGNRRAQMEAAGILAPLGYGIVGDLAGTALGKAAYAGGVPVDVARSIIALGNLGGMGYGTYRAYKRPGEM